MRDVETTSARRGYAPRLPGPQRAEQLLDAALDIALARGFHAVTIDGVARAAGVTRPVVYGLYVDRSALLAALLARAEQRALSQLSAALPAVPGTDARTDPDELLVAGVAAYLGAVAADPRTWRCILLPPEGAPPELHARLAGNRRVVLRQLRALCAWGLARRGGPAELDVELFARAVMTLADGAARLVLVAPDKWPVDGFVAFARTVLGALRPQP
jgi:AcrR family transcriptional regulator